MNVSTISCLAGQLSILKLKEKVRLKNLAFCLVTKYLDHDNHQVT